MGSILRHAWQALSAITNHWDARDPGCQPPSLKLRFGWKDRKAKDVQGTLKKGPHPYRAPRLYWRFDRQCPCCLPPAFELKLYLACYHAYVQGARVQDQNQATRFGQILVLNSTSLPMTPTLTGPLPIESHGHCRSHGPAECAERLNNFIDF